MRGIDQILAAIGALAQSEKRRSLPELLCVDCARALHPTTTVAMTLMNEAGHQAVLGASDPLASRLEELQFELGEGPSLEAFRSNLAVAHHDLGGPLTSRWPTFALGARAVGIEAIIALPLSVGEIRLGSLCMYRSTPRQLDEAQREMVQAYAGAAVVVLLHLQDQMWPSGALHPDLGTTVAYQAVVHQATGFVSVTASIGMTEALLLMRARAFASERPLRDIAQDVLSGRLRIHREESEDD